MRHGLRTACTAGDTSPGVGTKAPRGRKGGVQVVQKRTNTKRNSDSLLSPDGLVEEGAMAGDATGALLRPMPRVVVVPVSDGARWTGDAVQKMAGNDLCVAAIGSAEQVQANGLDDRPKEKLGTGRPRKDAALTLEQRKHRRCAYLAVFGCRLCGLVTGCSGVRCRRMLSKRVATKPAYHRRLEKMQSLQKENDFLRSLLLSLQKENDFLAELLAKRQQRQHKLEALVRASHCSHSPLRLSPSRCW